MPEVGMQNVSVQGLSDVLVSLESEVTVVQPPAEEYALQLEVTMVDRPGHPHPPAFSWNAGMILHIFSFMTSRATEDLSRMLLRTSEPLWQKHSLSGFPGLLIS